MPYAEVFEAFPEELRGAVMRLVDALKADLDVKRTDFEALRGAVQELAAAQTRTEARVEELAAAQARTEARLDRLTSAVEALAQAQARTEARVEELAQAQKRTDDALTLFRRTFLAQIGGLGARWGLQSEGAFRNGLRAVLAQVGFTTERLRIWDASVEVFRHREHI